MVSLRNVFLSLFCLSATAIISGCSSKGPAFVPLSSIPAGKGVVYIYREKRMAGGGVYGTVKANDVPVTKIKNGGYFPYVGDPGKVHFSVKTEATNTADVDVEEGKDKYLKTTVGIGFFVGHLKLTEVSRDIGSSEITGCRLLDAVQ